MQVTAIFALVASPIFVALQMKPSRDIAITAQHHDRGALAIEHFDELESTVQ